MQLFKGRFLVPGRGLRLQNDQLYLFGSHVNMTFNAGRHVSIVDENPKPIDAAIMRTVDNPVTEFIYIKVKIL